MELKTLVVKSQNVEKEMNELPNDQSKHGKVYSVGYGHNPHPDIIPAGQNPPPPPVKKHPDRIPPQKVSRWTESPLIPIFWYEGEFWYEGG